MAHSISKKTPVTNHSGFTTKRAFLTATVLATLLAGLAACGGGGGDESNAPCGGGQTLRLGFAYDVNGVLVDATVPIVLQRGVQTLAVPRIVGLPASCAGAARLSVLSSTSPPVSTGMVLDTKTGVLSGTPVSRGTFQVRLKIEIEGYTNWLSENVVFFI